MLGTGYYDSNLASQGVVDGRGDFLGGESFVMQLA